MEKQNGSDNLPFSFKVMFFFATMMPITWKCGYCTRRVDRSLCFGEARDVSCLKDMLKKASKYQLIKSDEDEVLVVHLGGLGDVCLSESVFFSLRGHFGDRLVALGNRRFLDLFGEYFRRTEGVESRRWLYLFSERLTGPGWKRIVFIGKDRQGSIRRRWKALSEEELIFIEMYPDGAFGPMPEGRERHSIGSGEDMHIEAYQLAQLDGYGIEPLRKDVTRRRGDRVILYPEEGFSKDKWPVENFIAILRPLRDGGVSAVLLRPPGLGIPLEGALFLEDLSEVKSFFSKGGIFVSNDSGMAHLAGACGLFTITVFTGFRPSIWRPRGNNISLRPGVDDLSIESLLRIIEKLNFEEGTCAG